MQQSTVTSFFKTKKRVREALSSQKSLSEIKGPGLGQQGSTNAEEKDDDGPPLPKSPKRVPAYIRFHHLAQKTTPEISLTTASTSTSSDLPVPVPLPALSASQPELTIVESEPTTVEKEKVSISTTTLPKVVEPIAERKYIRTQIPTSPSKANVGIANVAIPEPLLQLPYKFKMLQELFQGLETVASIFYNRKELITFSKVKPAVHQLVRRIQLKEKHLEQILTVFPDAYTLTQDKLKAKNFDGSEPSYQLIMTINLKNASGVSGNLSPAVISERRKIFHENLMKICHGHHKEFLSSLEPAIIIPAHKTVTRWHPKFRLDEIPDIKPNFHLPQAPETSNKSNSAKDVISKAQNILNNANPRMKKALAELLMKKTSHEQSSSVLPAPANSSKQEQDKNTKKTIAALKGVSQSLIDKIRAREQEKTIRAMTLTPEENQNKVMMSRLPEFVKSVRNAMVLEKKSALPLVFLVDRLCHSNHGLTPYEVENHIRLLTKLLPSWATLLKLSQGEYVKINKDANINDLLAKFDDTIKKKH